MKAFGLSTGTTNLATGYRAFPIHKSIDVSFASLHRRFQILDRRPIVDTVDDNRDVEVDGARRIVEEPAEPAVGAVDGEEIGAVSAAVRKILRNAGAQSAGCGILDAVQISSSTGSCCSGFTDGSPL